MAFAKNPYDHYGTLETDKLGLPTKTVHREPWAAAWTADGDADTAGYDIEVPKESADAISHAFDGTAEERQAAAEASRTHLDEVAARRRATY